MTDFSGTDLRRTVIDRESLGRYNGNQIIGYDATGQPIKQNQSISPFIAKRQPELDFQNCGTRLSPMTPSAQRHSQGNQGNCGNGMFYLPPPSVSQYTNNSEHLALNHWNDKLNNYRQHNEFQSNPSQNQRYPNQ